MSSLYELTSRDHGADERHFRRAGLAALVAFVSVILAVSAAAPALAEMQSPQWTVTAFSVPTNLAPGSTGKYAVEVKDTGGAPSDGSTIDVTDILPSGLSLAGAVSGKELLSDTSVSCTGATCSYSGVIVPDDSLVLTVPVKVASNAPEKTIPNMVIVAGGGAPVVSVETPTAISSTPAGFGIAPGSVTTVLSSTQAGAHADLTTTLAFNSVSTSGKLAGPPRSTVTDLPPGFAGDVGDSPTCSVARFSEIAGLFSAPPCPLSTQVGTTTLAVNLGYANDTVIVPVYNLSPNPGEVAKLGFEAVVFGVQGTISLRPGDYGVRTTFQNISETAAQLDYASLTIWGVPASPSHDALRGLECSEGECGYTNPQTGNGPHPSELPGGQSSTSPGIPFLTNPTKCTGVPLQETLTTTAWEGPSGPVSVQSDLGPLTGCGLLEFTPYITGAPDTTHADTPAGLTVDVKVPQEGLTSPEGFSTADIQNTTVTLPPGLVINPGQANGLEACRPSQEALGNEGPASCPSGSKVGHVEIRTPLLKEKLEGDVYVLQSNPPDVKLLVTAYAPNYGIYVKLVGDVHMNTSTGQLTTTFDETPELPFTDFKLSFSGGAQAALATPTGCGTYTTNADFAPWSGESDALVSSNFAIESGPEGSACASPLPFDLSMSAGATTDQAGGFTNFSLLLGRADGQQRISTLQFKTPEGLLGMIGKVSLCQEPQARDGTCPAASQIGHTVVEAGPGPYPLVVPQPGQPPAPIYLTGGYERAPYGLSIAVPVVAGPFNFGTIVVRSKIEVDPHTAQLTVTTDPLPSIIEGVPADLRTINAVVDRPGFMFNPTNCNPQSFSGSATSTEGTTAPISSHFQVGSCQSLKFKPDFKVSTSGKTSRTDGASLNAKIVYPTGVLPDNQASSQSNIKSVKVDLPKQLPSRLTTLQKACTAAQFESNPAGCPAASVVGHAKAITPALPVPLEGPAYFVSHGGEAFPSLIVVLQGYGVTVDLVGTTFISKAGITSSTFKTVPDVPVGSFELTLPRGKDSALAANGNLCKSKLAMPTAFVAQNGAVIHQSTKIAVTGCPKHKARRKAKKASVRHRKGRGGKKQ
jgi:uncharacterized repeat protein (TIGR01451 family)